MSDKRARESKSATPPQNADAPQGTPTPGNDPASRRRMMNGVFLTAVGGLAIGLALLKRGPQAAAAAAPDFSAASLALDERVSAELPRVRNVDRALGSVDKLIDGFRFSPVSVQVPLMELKVNPFRRSAADNAPATQDESSEVDLREQERQAALKAVQSLRLQSILHGGPLRACVINNARYQEGQDAGGFLVEEIASNAVVVRKGVFRFELKVSM